MKLSTSQMDALFLLHQSRVYSSKDCFSYITIATVAPSSTLRALNVRGLVASEREDCRSNVWLTPAGRTLIEEKLAKKALCA